MIIASDVDDVVANFLPAWLHAYNKLYNDNLAPDAIATWDDICTKTRPECQRKVYDIIQEPDFYDQVQPIAGAFEGVRWLREQGHRVVFVTSSIGPSMDAKRRWLMRYGFIPQAYAADDYVVAHDKALIRAEILIDDRPKNIANFPGKRVLYHQPWNRAFTDFGGIRMMQWSEISTMLKILHSPRITTKW